MPKATLINKDGDRQAIETGSDGEKDLFDQGYELETEAPSQTDVPATYVNNGDKTTVAGSGQTQSDLYGDGYTPEVNLYESVYGKDNEPTGAISSSEPADVVTKTIAEEIKDGQEKTDAEIEAMNKPKYKEYTDHTEDIQNSRDAGETMLADQKANIEADFELRKYEQSQSNRVQTGFASKQLARWGSFGRSASGMDYMKSVQVRNEQEINKLLVQKQKLLLSADEAFAKNDWTLLAAKIRESKAITDQYNKIQTWQFEDSMKTAQEATRQQKFGWEEEDRAMEKISTIAGSGMEFSEMTPDEVTKLATDAKIPEESIKGLFELSKEKADLEKNKSLIALLNTIDKGQIVEIGGNFYTGMKDSKLTLVTDGVSGVQYALKENADGEIEKINLGIKGKGQPGGYDEKALAKMGGAISSAYAEGAHGGQCGSFVRKIISTWPTGLNSQEEKDAQIDPNIGSDPEQSLPQVGDVVIQYVDKKSSSFWEDGVEYPTGHVSVINNFDPETGIMTLTESNWGKFELVSNTRTLHMDDKQVNGFYRGNVKSEFVNDKFENEEEVTQVEFDDYITKTKKDMAEGTVTWEDGHSQVYKQYKEELDALAVEYDYTDGRLLLDDLLDKTNFNQ